MGSVAVPQNNDALMKVLQTSLYPGADINSIGMVIEYCKCSGLDPMQKPVHIVPMWDSKAGSMRDVIMPGIGLYRIQASRSGEYGGISEAEYGPDITENLGGVEITYPQWCKITVSRMVAGQVALFTAVERWKENYAVRGGKERSIAPNAMWMKRPYAQIAKCAEAQALRKAFPEVGAMPTAEEMEGKSFDDEPKDITPKRAEPAIYPADKYIENFPVWEKLIQDGKKTPAQIIAMVQSKGALTEAQKHEINSVGEIQ